jgi:hypothetical protein
MMISSSHSIDVVARFLGSKSVECRPGAWIPFERCHQRLADWCAWNDFTAPTAQHLRDSLQEKGFRTDALGDTLVVFGLGSR